jgi:hypothetical protein
MMSDKLKTKNDENKEAKIRYAKNEEIHNEMNDYQSSLNALKDVYLVIKLVDEHHH